jgi:hypothetical protein
VRGSKILDSRAKRIVWGFLLGVIAVEGWATWASFRAKGNLFAALTHYATTPAGTPLAWVTAAIVTALYAWYAAYRSPVIADYMLRPWRWGEHAALRMVAVPMALISGFFEEVFFRKFLMDWAMHSGHSILVQIAVSALAFGAVHAVWGVMGGSLRAAFGAMLATGTLGAALGTVYVFGGRSIGPCIAAHVAINLLIEPWLMITAATHRWRRETLRQP